MTQEEKIEAILEWAEDHDFFDIEFVETMGEKLEEYGELTDRQESALDNIIEKFRI